MRLSSFLYVLLGSLLLIGCGRGPSQGPAPARPASTELRIVALSPALAIILKDLGYEAQIVGRHAYDLALDPSIPTCGELGTIDYETLLRVRPTHVFIQWGAQSLPPRLLELAKANKWVVQNYNPLSLDEIAQAAREMDETVFRFATRGLEDNFAGADTPSNIGNLEPPDHIKPAMPFEDAMGLAWSDRGPFVKAAGRILLVSGTKPIGALGPGSFHYQLLQRLGGTPVPTTGGPWITLGMEDLNKLAPDAIIIFAPRAPRSPAPPPATPDELIALFGRAGELPIPAFKNKRVALIDDPLCLTPSTAMIPIANQIADIVSNWGQSTLSAPSNSGGR